MGLVWQCARCGKTDSGTEDQREGRHPPESWVQTFYVPVRGNGGARSRRVDTICDRCEDSLYEWFQTKEADRG